MYLFIHSFYHLKYIYVVNNLLSLALHISSFPIWTERWELQHRKSGLRAPGIVQENRSDEPQIERGKHQIDIAQ